MKEATGELNSTVIVVIAVAGFAAFFFSYLWPIISDSIDKDTRCADAVCYDYSNKDGYVDCYMPDTDKKNTFQCVYKG